ncbi:hypothetical protein B0T24DRAFT_418960 [Lasiosphaeria ovina]|uniref:non-specific serine/threonine protein kinase n=1 Tax=Lasiosphaeria ovina TaxID=92902 RepID=A0AAE0JUS3_9PEZI|nr:hypothetical protein B0T24DRAFT_418960 [Lasiosphaeria ovina]
MDHLPRSKIISDNPIGNGLDAFRASFRSACESANVSCTLDTLEQLGQEDLQKTVLTLFGLLQMLPAIHILRSKKGYGSLCDDLIGLYWAIRSNSFDFDRIKPLVEAALADDPDDALVWDRVYNAVTESTPPPRPIASSLQQTPWVYTTDSSEYRHNADPVLLKELDNLYIGLPLYETYFGGVAGLEAASETVFKKCKDGSNPLFSNGWSGWPAGAKEKDVLAWFRDLIPKLETFAEGLNPTSTFRRKLLTQPITPLLDSIGQRSLNIGFIEDFPTAGKGFRYRWSHILVPGELKSNPSADAPSKARIDLATYAREVLAAQDTRRFVLGFTICGSFMRIWVFDRLGGIASEKFDINKDGLQFVSTVLGFLWMNEEELGFDPTIMTANGERFIEIERDGLKERVIIDRVIQRVRCIAGRASTCWKAHPEGYRQIPLVIKDSWQCPERDEEGDLLREATGKGVANMARYYYHTTVQVNGTDDDVRSNIRKGLDIPKQSVVSPSKRSNSASLIKADDDMVSNRVHRRIILRDYGKSIYKASSRAALLAGLEGCIEGHESLYNKAGLLHRDISINNLMINEDVDNPSWSSFLIDLDLAARVQPEGASGAKSKVGTRAFMAIGVLLGEQHSFMHDLESFFWVLCWLCIHYDAQGRFKPTEYDCLNYFDDDSLAGFKKGEVIDERDFLGKAERHFSSYYQPLIPCVNKLRKAVFPDGRRWRRREPALYSSMKEILREARKDPNVVADDG